ncbi:STAS domain-containing protein [Lentzea sp. NPDC051208]|uniref:STAS domain-containing protein n=1 Tax=Lentzea sp. NPDC051208 TaxID=3154642 RepID=UPI0034490E29
MDPQLHGHAPFTVEIRAKDDIPIVAVTGEIDLSNEDVIQAEISDQLDRRPPLLVIDLRKVTFMGSAGIRLLIGNHMTATSSGIRLPVVAAHHAVLRPLEVTEVDQQLELITDQDDPLSQLACN